jgi:nucleotide-binding universal stress UspA family protein
VKTFSRILIPVDFSECSRAALDTAATLAVAVGATVDLLHVWQPLSRPHSAPPWAESLPAQAEFDRARAAVLLNEVAEHLRAQGVRVGRELIGGGDPGEEIDLVAQEEDYDLIVVGTHGRSGLRRFFLGSVAAHVVQHARCPVLVVPPDT